MKTRKEINEYILTICPSIQSSDLEEIGNVDYFDSLVGPADLKTATRKLARIHRLVSILYAAIKARKVELEETMNAEELSTIRLLYLHQKQIRSGLFPLEDKIIIEEHAQIYLNNIETIDNMLKDKNSCIDKSIGDRLKKQHISQLSDIKYTVQDISMYTSIDVLNASDLAIKRAAEAYVSEKYEQERKSVHMQDTLLGEFINALRIDINTVNQLGYTISQEQRRISKEEYQDKNTSKF